MITWGSEPHQEMVQHAIDVLNRIHIADPTVMPKLITTRMPCNEELVDDITVQVGINDNEDGYEVGFLGILNGCFGIMDNGWGWITAIIEDGDLIRFDWSKNHQREDK